MSIARSLLASALVPIALLPGCTRGGPESAPDDPNEARRVIARQLFDALSRFDVIAVDDLYAENFVLWSPGSLPFAGTHDKAEALELMGQISSAFPEGLHFTVDAMTVEGERVAVEAHCEGRHVSGRDYRNRYHFLLKIRDGKIVLLKEYMDTQRALDVLFPGAPGAGSGG
jgi:ketosteroid isomerase-like protein